MQQTNHYVFKGLIVTAWIIFTGLCIEAGALLVNFIFSLYNPALIPYLYQKLDLSNVYQHSSWAFYSMYSLILTISLLKTFLFYILAMLVSKTELSTPFNRHVSGEISRISYYTFTIGLFSYISRTFSRSLQHRGIDTDKLLPFLADAQAYILMAAVIFVIATIFEKGVALQTENDLTV